MRSPIPLSVLLVIPFVVPLVFTVGLTEYLPLYRIQITVLAVAIAIGLSILIGNWIQETFEVLQTCARESENKLKDVQRVASVGCWEANLVTNDLFWSEELFRIAGRDPQEFKPHYPEVLELMHPDDRFALEAAAEQAISKGISYEVEGRMIRPDGTIRYVINKGEAICDASGNIISIFGTTSDITKFKHLELALQASEAKLIDIINTPVASIIRTRIFANYDWDIDYLSEGCEAVFGYNKQEFINNKSIWMASIVPEDLENVIMPLFKEIFLEKTVSFEYRFYHKNGSIRWLATKMTSRYQRDVDCWFVNQFTVDITERKQIEEALLYSENINRAIVNAMPDLVIRMRRDGTYLDVKLTDVFPSIIPDIELSGQNIQDFMPPDVAQQILAITQKALEIGKMQIDEFNLDIQGQYRSEEARVMPLNADEVLVLIRDITDRKQVEIELQQRAEREQLLNQVIQAIHQSLDLSTIFSTATEGIAQLLRIDHAVIARYLPECHRWVHISAYRKNLELSDEFGLEIPDEGNPFAAQLKQGEIVLISNTQTIEDSINKELAAQHPGAWLLIPLNVNGIVWGSLSLSHSQPICWQDDQIELVRRVAQPLAIAIHQANLYQQSQQAEQYWRRSEARLMLALEISKTIAWEEDLSTNNIYLTSATKLLPSDIIPYQELLEFIHPDDRELIVQKKKEAIDRTGIFELEYRVAVFPQSNSRWRWFQAYGQIVKDANFNPISLVGMSIDITERKQTEARLQASEARYRGIVEDQNEMIARFGSDRKITFVNEAFCRYFGIEQEKLLGYDYKPVVFEEDLEYVTRLISSMSRENPALTIENRVIARGEIRWTQWSTRIVFDEQGQFVEFQSVGRDIHDHKLAEKALRESEARLRSLADNLPGAIFTYSYYPNGTSNLEYISEGCTELFGISTQEILDNFSVVIERFHPEDLPGYYAAIEASTNNLTPFSYEWRYLHPRGETCWLTVSSRPEVRSDGSVAWRGVLLDISDRKQAEAELQRAKEAAEAASRAKSEFLANMSHEIRTPMNAILGFCELLQNLMTESQPRSYLQAISASGKTLLALINDILDLSKIEAGRLEINYEPLNLRVLMAEICQIFAQQASEKKLSLLLEIDQTIPKGILFDEVRLRQILFNVVGNAIKFTEQGYIKIFAYCQNYLNTEQANKVCLQIAVEDTGIGIPSEQQANIFDAFIQVEGQKKRKYGGTGLGLAIVQRLTHLLNGKIMLQSQLGKGSTFRFTFPVTIIESVPQRILGSNLDDNLDQFKPANILVVDDVNSNLQLIESFFSKTKHKIILANNGLTAINIVRYQQIDLILLDLRMPDLDGWEVSKILKQDEQTRDIPIIIITASALDNEPNNWHLLCQGFLIKPISQQQLFSEVRKFLLPDESSNKSRSKTFDAVQIIDLQAISPDSLEKLPELIEKLRQEEENVWPKLCNSMIRRELKQFASRLQTYGIEYNNSYLLNYAETLANQIDAFDFDLLPETIKNFPEVRITLEQYNFNF